MNHCQQLGILMALLFGMCHANGVTVTVDEITDTTAKLTVSRASNFLIGTIDDDASAGTYTPSPIPTTAATSFEFEVTGLTAGTQYTFTAGTMTNDANPAVALSPADSDSAPTCTKPTPVSDVKVDATGTNETVIKVTWTNPATPPEKLVLMFDTYEIAVSDPTVEEYEITMKAANTLLTAGTSGKCKVITEITSAGNCQGQQYPIEVDCSTSMKSAAATLLPKATLLLCVLYRVFNA